MSRCQAILETTGQTCNSNLRITKVRVEDPNNHYSKTLAICQRCSDAIYGPMDALLQMWMKKTDIDRDIKNAELSKIRWKNCRHCNHNLDCHCTDIVCQNKFNEIWHIVFYSFTGKFRQDFQLHRRCAFIIMRKLGMVDKIKPSQQTGMESFLEIKLTDPPKPQHVETRIQVFYKKHCKTCDIWFEPEQYKSHMNQHYRESSTDSNIERQFSGIREKKEEAYVCEKHSKKAIALQTGEPVCPVFGCTEELKKKMISVKDVEDYLICMYHQCKIKYDPNEGKMRCQIPSCESKVWLKRSYLLSMVKQGYIEHNGQKVPIDVESRTVELDGKRILLKI